MATKKPARSVRTKSETKAELDEIIERNERTEPLPAKEAEMQAARKREVLNEVKDLSVEAAVQKVTSVGLDVSRSLAAVSEQLVEQTKQLDTVREAVRLETAELERLYKADVVASSIDTLLSDFKAQEAVCKQKIEDLEAQYKAFQAESDKRFTEAEAERAKMRAREDADFKYNLTLTRKKDEDAFAATKAQRERDEAIRLQDLTRSWTDRENALKNREAELVAYKARIDALPAEIEKAKADAIAETTKTLNSSKHFEVSHLKKDMDAAKAMSDMQIASLKEANAKLADQVVKLSAELSAANAQVKSIAEKALDSSSGQRTLAEVTSLMQNQQGNGAQRGKS